MWPKVGVELQAKAEHEMAGAAASAAEHMQDAQRAEIEALASGALRNGAGGGDSADTPWATGLAADIC